MNKVILIGNLTKDPELTTTNSGINCCKFTVAVQRKFSNAEGEREADFINCVAWRALADNVNKYLTKGKRCAVVGAMQTRSYDAKDGTKRYVTEVLVDEVEFLSSKPNTEDEGNKAPIKPLEGSYKQQNMGELTPITEELQPIDDDSEMPF